MKKIATTLFCAFLLASIATIHSCNEIPLIIPYNVGEQTFCLPANPYEGYQTYTFDIDHDDIVAAMSAAGITDVGRVTKAGLKPGFKAVISTTGADLDEIANVEVYMKLAGTGGTGNQIAYSDNIGAGATEVGLLISGAELKEAVTNDVTITVKILNKPTGNSAVCVKLTSGIIEVSVRK